MMYMLSCVSLFSAKKKQSNTETKWVRGRKIQGRVGEVSHAASMLLTLLEILPIEPQAILANLENRQSRLLSPAFFVNLFELKLTKV